MEKDEEIGQKIYEFINGDVIPHNLPNAQGYFMSIGAFTREMVGERPRMVIERMTVDEIQIEMQKITEDNNYLHPETYLKAIAINIHRLANTPVPVVDPDALAKKIAWIHASTSRITNGQNDANGYWLTFSERDQVGWRAVAKLVEERK